eukprot:m.162483 g.162483  ORF g.162483 m.162483 type:complete len:1196 (+) comp16533_c0_seq1:148-3735(+)
MSIFKKFLRAVLIIGILGLVAKLYIRVIELHRPSAIYQNHDGDAALAINIAQQPSSSTRPLQLDSKQTTTSLNQPFQQSSTTRGTSAPVKQAEPAMVTRPRTIPSANRSRARILVLVITGGSKAATLTNRQAVLATWATEDVYFVTTDVVNTSRVIRLPARAEAGGLKGLPTKVLLSFAHVAQSPLLEAYDFVMKADDDTFVNLPRLQRELSLLDPEALFYGGCKRFNAHVPKTKAVNAFYTPKNSLKFAHGGAGYILSRGTLRAIQGVLEDCIRQPPLTTLEDAKMSTCLYSNLGLEAVDMQRAVFGKLDVFNNRHSQDKHTALLDEMSDRSIAIAGSFHSVQGKTQEAIHRRLGHLTSEQREQMLETVATTLNTTGRADSTLTSMHACNDDLGDEQSLHGVCFRSLFATANPLPILTDRPVSVDLDWGTLPCSLPHLVMLTISRLEQLRLLPLTLQSLTKSKVCAVVVLLLPSEVVANPSVMEQLPKQVHHVTLPEHTPKQRWHAEQRAALATVTSLLAHLPSEAGHHVSSLLARMPVLFQQDIFSWVSRQQRVVLVPQQPPRWSISLRCGIVQTNQLPLHPLLNTNVSMAPLAAHARYLTAALHLIKANPHLGRPNTACHLVDVLSEAVWFKQMAVWVPVLLASPWHGPISSLSKTSSEGVRWWHTTARDDTQYPVTPVLQQQQQQQPLFVVNHHAKPAALVLVTDSYVDILSGSTLPATLSPQSNAPSAPVSMSPPALPAWVSRVWQERAAAKKKRQQLRQAGPPAKPIVKVDPGKGMSRLPEADKKAGLSAAVKSMTLEVRQLETSMNTGDGIGVLTNQQWPIEVDVKQAYNKFFAKAQPVRTGAFAEVQAVLSEYRRRFPLRLNVSTVTQVVSPKTHKTGSSTLASILFRYGARRQLRMFRRGNWAFFPGGVISSAVRDPALKGAYDLDFHHLTPNGKFQRSYASVEAFYQHITGTTAPAKIAVVREPKQQLTSYAYYYYVPGNRDKFEGGHQAAFLHFLNTNRTANQVAGGFGLYTEQATQQFVARWLPTFDIMLLSERFEEGLVLLRRLFNWDPLDITYVRLLDSHSTAGSRRWDGRRLDPTPRIPALPKAAQEHLNRLTQLDQLIYNASVAKFEEQLRKQGADFHEEVALFKKLNSQLSQTCSKHKDTHACLFYALSDVQYFRLISSKGYSPAWQLDGSSSLPTNL